METYSYGFPHESTSDVFSHEAYSDLQQAREQYLMALTVRKVLEPGSSWSFDFDQLRDTYVRGVGERINAVIQGVELAGGGSDDKSDVLVHILNDEKDCRWQTYSSLAESSGKEQDFEELCQELQALSDMSTDDYDPVRKSWEGFLKSYGATGAEFGPSLRAEFIRTKLVWDLSQEDKLLRELFPREVQQSTAA